VPGALTNQPLLPASPRLRRRTSRLPRLPPPARRSPGHCRCIGPCHQCPGQYRSQSTKNYEIDRTVAYTRQPAGQLKRLTVAVVVDDMRSSARTASREGPTADRCELAHITTLVKDAVGFDEARGDSVNVVNAAFRTMPRRPTPKLEKVPMWRPPSSATWRSLAPASSSCWCWPWPYCGR